MYMRKSVYVYVNIGTETYLRVYVECVCVCDRVYNSTLQVLVEMVR